MVSWSRWLATAVARLIRKAGVATLQSIELSHTFLRHSGLNPTIIDFFPYGYDERQFCSPGFNLPVGLFQRSRFGQIPQYHTSADNLEFISADHLAQSYGLIASTADIIENDTIYRNTMPRCEPQLGKRGLYRVIGQDRDAEAANLALLWVLNLSDGVTFIARYS